jgi:hypothetical protein
MTNFSSRIFNNEPYFDSRSTLLVVCTTIALSYLVPTLVGMLVSNPQTVWPLWPGCAILVTGLLLVRVSVWPLLILTSFVGFALADLRAGVPLSSIAWFIPGNTVEVLISAVGLKYCFNGVPRLNSVRALAKYSFFAIVLAPFARHRPRLLDGLEDLFFVRGSCLRHGDPGPVELGKRRACIDAKIACPSPRGLDTHRGAGSCRIHRVHGP